jgi:hypothetical protein
MTLRSQTDDVILFDNFILELLLWEWILKNRGRGASQELPRNLWEGDETMK